MNNIPRGILFGVAVGDALGVPFEFLSRTEMDKAPARNMIGFMSHNQPPGTWSDDSSLTFCLSEALLENYSLANTAEKFILWKNIAYWTARGKVFDIGMTTSMAITRLEKVIENSTFGDLEYLNCEGEEFENGNGALMRILPLILEIRGIPIAEQFDVVWKNSALTHRHVRSAMCCLIYLKFAENLIEGNDKITSYNKVRNDILHFWDEINFAHVERRHFKRIIERDITAYDRETILSGGYVIESLEASLWCILTTNTFESSVLKAVNLGDDTDTTGAITGGLAGICYGYKSIPENWIESVARMDDIERLSDKLNVKYFS